MRVFLSAYSGFTLAIPMEAVASMVLYKQKTEKIVQYDPGSRSTYVSLPWLFNMPDQAVPHGVVLREMNSKENKVVLLTAEVKRDIEIPDEEFHPIPKAWGALRFSEVFSGIKFSGDPVLLLNTEQLLQVIQNEQLVTDKKPNLPEQPVPVVPSEPSPPAPNKVIEEPPKNSAVASEASSLTIDKILEVCGVINKPPIEKPPISSEVTAEPSSLALEPQTSPQGVEPEVRVSPLKPLDEVLVLCEIIDDPPISPAETSEPSPQISNEDIELCEDIEVCEDIEPCEVIELCETIEVCEITELCETVEVCEVIEDPSISPADTSEPSSLAINEVLVLCEI